jgi:hypothetical protein
MTDADVVTSEDIISESASADTTTAAPAEEAVMTDAAPSEDSAVSEIIPILPATVMPAMPQLLRKLKWKTMYLWRQPTMLP